MRVEVIDIRMAVIAVPGNCINLAEMPSIPSVFRHCFAGTVIGVACIACASQSYDVPNTLGVLPPPRPAPLWLGTVRGSGSTGISGAASVTPSQTPGWMHALISVGNGVAGGTYAWSLRSGSCAAQGNVVGPDDRYGDFTIHADGSGAAEAAVPVMLSPSASYAVVATPVLPATAPVACADLTLGSM